MKAQIGLIGLAVMGENLALNIANNNIKIAVYNRTIEKTTSFLKRANKLNIYGASDLKEFINMLEKPRKIVLMIKAGQPVDNIIDSLIPLLDKEDIIIDAGNSYFLDTIKRTEKLHTKNIRYLGMGVSGGEEGALLGPSLMPGGDKSAYDELLPIFEKISAKVNDTPCVAYIGEDGAGHFVKTVHNGIEYADMQLISEIYYILKNIYNLNNEEMSSIFAKWNNSELESYLIEITANILLHKDNKTNNYLIDMILDDAKQKGTGKWTVQSALDLGVAVPTIAEAVFARCLSAQKQERLNASQQYSNSKIIQEKFDDNILDDLKKALYASKICAYAQGFDLINQAAKEHNWSINNEKTALIWRGGCIIRAKMLSVISEAFQKQFDLPNLLVAKNFIPILKDSEQSLQKVVIKAQEKGLAIPALSSTLAYYKSYTTSRLPANLLQAQRDYFGAHTYKRIDEEGTFHTQWQIDN